MRTGGPSQAELLAELADLRARLAEAEEAVRAIRTGDVDAVVVAGDRGEQVYTLTGADRAYRQLIETMSEGAATLSADGTILYGNVRAAEMLGRPLDQVLGTALRNYLPPDDQPALAAVLAQISTGPIRREVSLKTSDGRLTPAYLSVSRLPGETAGTVFCLVLTDLTEQKRNEATAAAERLARMILEQTAEAIVVCDEQGRVIRVSQAARRFCDGNLFQRPFCEVFPLRSDGSNPISLAEVMQGETLRNVDVALDRQGQHHHLILNAGPLRSGQQVLGSVVTLTDITERKLAEEAVRASLSLLSATIEATADGILVVDLTGAVVRFNRRFLELWRIPDALAQSRDDGLLLDCVVAQLLDPEAFLERVRAFYQTPGASGTDELRFTDGRIFERFTGPQRIGEAIVGRVWSFRDITEHRRAEESVRQSEALNRNLVGHLPQRIFLKDRNLAYVFCNSNFALDQGIEPKQIVGKDDFAFFSPELAERYRADDREVMADGKTKDISERYDVAGEERWVHTVKIPFRNERGEIIGVLGLFEDVTERKRAERALRERERSLMEAQRVAHVGSWERVLETGVVIWSDELRRIYGVDAKLPVPDFEGLAPFYTPESWVRLRKAVENTVQSGAPLELDVEIVRADGTVIWAATRGEAVRDATGRIVGTRGTILDISEGKHAEAELRLQSAALNAAADAIVITNRDGAIEWTNPAFTVFTGYSAAEAIGRNPGDLVKSGVHDQAFYKDLWDTILAGAVWRGEITNRRKDGSLYAESQAITPVKGADGTITHFVAIKRDLTIQKRLEAQFLQSQKMESVGRLAGGIAHDFNNLLTVINGTAELTSMDLRPDDPLRVDLEEIRRAGVRAAALTRQLLAFSRKQIMDVEVLRLGTLVADMQGMLVRLIGENIHLVVVPSKDVDTVKADRGQIEQVVLNLVVNARDAMPDGGALTIETRVVELDEAYADGHPSTYPGPHVVLSVSDTGIGMDETTRARIFEPFFTTKELGKGTGLGLSTVYGIVQQSGGSVSVYSEPGRGATFKIYLPLVGEVASVVEPAHAVAGMSATETIFVVEDERSVRMLATRILTSAGYTVLACSTAEEALQSLARHDGPVHLLLTDVILPGMSGRELATRLAAVHPEIKVLYSSGYTDDAIVRHGVLDKTSHFIGKPYTIADLRRKVRAVLDRTEVPSS